MLASSPYLNAVLILDSSDSAISFLDKYGITSMDLGHSFIHFFEVTEIIPIFRDGVPVDPITINYGSRDLITDTPNLTNSITFDPATETRIPISSTGRYFDVSFASVAGDACYTLSSLYFKYQPVGEY